MKKERETAVDKNKAARNVRLQSNNYGVKVDPKFETSVDRPPRFTPAMEKEEERINKEADERAAAGATTDENGQVEVFGETEEDDKPRVRGFEVSLILKLARKGQSTSQVILIDKNALPADRVVEVALSSFNWRSNKRKIEAMLDLPIPEDTNEANVEAVSELVETTAEATSFEEVDGL